MTDPVEGRLDDFLTKAKEFLDKYGPLAVLILEYLLKQPATAHGMTPRAGCEDTCHCLDEALTYQLAAVAMIAEHLKECCDG